MRFVDRIEHYVGGQPALSYVYEFVRFGVLSAWCSLFGGILLAALLFTYLFYPTDVGIARYDALFLFALCVQVVLVVTKLETKEEAFVIFIFHVVGTVMELFKTHVGSWVYPEMNLIRIGGVPLFTGFMYASVGSYIARSWRVLDFRFWNHPTRSVLALLSLAMYANFFTHHYVPDMRVVLFAATVVLFRRTWIYFTVWKEARSMPLLVGFFLVAFFIWIAENVGTFSGAWVYPNQIAAWHMVSLGKLGSWFMLVVISYCLVSLVHEVREYHEGNQ